MTTGSDESAVARFEGRTARPSESPLSEARWELIELCVRVTQLLGFPRSVGEIFGFIFASGRPVTFEDVVQGLGVSNGSASHGLRYLRRLGAIQAIYHARDRRDFFEAEKSLHKMVSGFVSDEATQGERGDDPILSERIHLLQSWNEQAASALDAALKTLK
jgi:DNA-binding transcriptional regulator GbsR (MarR family)